MKSVATLLLSGLVCALAACGADFFPAVQPAGETSVTLHPIESTPTNQAVRVSFGVPFPRGFMTNLATLRLLDAQGNEVPVFVKALTPWRDLAAGQDRTSIRSALVQAQISFADTNGDGLADEQHYTIQWGQAQRQQPPLAETPVRTDWVAVNDAEYPGTNSVFEPKAYALFTPDWYGQCLIKTRLVPFGSHPSFTAYDLLFPQFGNTAVNRVDPEVTAANLVPYLTDYEPWLFDRAMTLYQLAFRSGDIRFLRAAHRASQFYANHINAQGWFDMRGDEDLKYCYGECLCADFWLTGDDRLPAVLQRMIPVMDGFNIVYTLDSNFWTERHSAYKLLGYVTAFELLGDPALAEKARDAFGALVNMQENPVPGAANLGGLMHTSASHGEGGAELIASPWMSTLLIDAVERYYIHSADSRVPRFVQRMADFVLTRDVATYLSAAEGYSTNTAGQVFPSYPFSDFGNVPRLVPFYLAGPGLTSGQHDQDVYSDIEHALDVGKILALAYFLSGDGGSPNTNYLTAFSELYQTFNEATALNWIRPEAPDVGYTIFRLSPPRKFNWWFRTTANLDWLVGLGTRLQTAAEAQAARLELTVSADKASAVPGDVITYTITCRNTGTKDAFAIQLFDQIRKFTRNTDPDLVVLADTISGGGVQAGDIFWPVGDLAAGAPARTFSFQVLVQSNAIAQTVERPLSPYLNRAFAGFCSAGDPASDCLATTSPWDPSKYSRTTAGNLILTRRPITKDPLRPDVRPPAAPDNFRFVGGGSNQVQLAWLPTTEYDLKGFSVYRGPSDSGPWTSLSPALITAHGFTDSNLSNHVTYYYTVSATDTAGNESQPSGSVFANAYPTPPPPALSLSLLPGGDAQFNITGGIGWSYDLYYSFDLLQWSQEDTVTVGLDGSVQYLDEYIPHNYPQAFWRAQLPTPSLGASARALR